jgi:hypothetical protein
MLPPLVAPADELKEHVRRVRLHGQVAQLVDDEQLRLAVVQELLVQAPRGVRGHELRDERRRRREKDGVARRDDRPADADGEVRLAHARRPEEQHRLAVRHEAPRRELAHLLLVDGGLRAEVVAGEVADHREAGEAEHHLDARSSFRAISRSQSSATVSASVSSRRAASASSGSSWSRIAVSLSRVSIAASRVRSGRAGSSGMACGASVRRERPRLGNARHSGAVRQRGAGPVVRCVLRRRASRVHKRPAWRTVRSPPGTDEWPGPPRLVR